MFVDVGAGKNRYLAIANICPCITRNRGANLGFFLLLRHRALVFEDICRLQGHKAVLDFIDKQAGISRTRAGQCLGNAMSINVLEASTSYDGRDGMPLRRAFCMR